MYTYKKEIFFFLILSIITDYFMSFLYYECLFLFLNNIILLSFQYPVIIFLNKEAKGV